MFWKRFSEARRRLLLLISITAAVLLLAAGLSAPLWAASLSQTPFLQGRTQQTADRVSTSGSSPGSAPITITDQPEGERAWLGIVVSNADGAAKVRQVLPGSPAAKAGVRKDDLIVAVDDTKVGNAQDVVNVVQKRKPGDKVVLQIKRGGEDVQITVEVQAFPPGNRQPFGPRRLPPELKGLEGLPWRNIFGNFLSSTIRMKDKDGNELVINVIPGTLANATATSLTITPNDGVGARQFDVSDDTAVFGAGRSGKVQDIPVNSKVLVITVGDSAHASIVIRVSAAFNPLGEIVPGLAQPRLWPLPGIEQFREWRQNLIKPTPQPTM